ncbi:hypothetical protein N7489_000110, partial [Penicillium chrysogenum]
LLGKNSRVYLPCRITREDLEKTNGGLRRQTENFPTLAVGEFSMNHIETMLRLTPSDQDKEHAHVTSIIQLLIYVPSSHLASPRSETSNHHAIKIQPSTKGLRPHFQRSSQ